MPVDGIIPQPGAPAVDRSVLHSPQMRIDRGLRGKLRWHLNAAFTRRTALLNAFGARLTVVDAYGAPGDTLLTAIICRHVRQRRPRLRINCLTPNPELLRYDPNIDTLNAPEDFFSVWSWYPNLAGRRDAKSNILSETLGRLGWPFRREDYRARVYLTDEERARGAQLLDCADRPVITVSTRTKEPTKNWPEEAWHDLLAELAGRFHFVQLGDAREPQLEGVQRLAGRLSMRESMSVLSHAKIHVGGDSFLMHAANGLDVPSVIIFGGARTPANLGYSENLNLYSAVPCSPCWLHESKGERCAYCMFCMNRIGVGDGRTAIERLAAGIAAP